MKQIAKSEVNMNVNPGDVKISVEIPTRHVETETIERRMPVSNTIVKTSAKPIKKAGKKKPAANKTEKIESSPKTEKITKMKKTGNAILIITEKPQAAMKIAAALSDGKEKKLNDAGVPFYEFVKNGRKIIVGCAVGHLFGIGQKEKGAAIPNFDVEWKPNYENKGAEFTRKYFNLLKKLSQQASEFIVATDYDIEGEVIGWNVIRFISKEKDAKRMKFSSLTKDELTESFENLQPTINWGQAIAGETRHFVDWFYGINLSRALMRALKAAGRFKILSIGRVQGPALAIIVDKELEIRNFKSTPYWQVFLQIQDIKGQKLEVKYPRDLISDKELLKFKQLKGKKGQAKTEIKEEKIAAPTPFDLTTLQTESYRFFRLSPAQTLQIAQKLYLEGLISYPRTSSQKYPESIGYQKILGKLGKKYPILKYAVNKKPTEGKKTDPAHPAIYPTGDSGKLADQERKVYELIVRRFVSCFCDAAIVDNKKVEVSVNDLLFNARGVQIKEKNWMNVYKSSLKEEEIPTINGEVDIREIRIEEKMTQPPKRYTQASLVKELESRNLGTKSTRAAIIETLYDRNYMKGTSVEASPLGIKMVETLRKYSPIILDEELTRTLEQEMEEMQLKNNNLQESEKHALEEAKKAIVKITNDMKKHEIEIGKALDEANTELREEQRKENTLNKCPKCNEGNLRILFNRGIHRYFVACDKYPECKTTFSLPPNALIKPAGENCPECNFPMLLAIRKAKRPWKFCFNPVCKTNEEWQKKAAEKREEILKNPGTQNSIVEKKEDVKKED